MQLKFKEIDLVELNRSFWDWVQNIPTWTSPEGLLARVLICVVVLYFIFRVVKHIIELIASLCESLRKIGWRISLSATEKANLRRRRQFASVLRSDLATLAKAENWNDQFFTDLEAEVEAEGSYYATALDRLIGRKSSGLRRVPSLIQAIESSAEQFLLIIGEPGSGKSIAMRHLAHQLAERAIRSKDLNEKLPLYVNLKELPLAPDGIPTADFIRQFVINNIRRGDADTADYVREHWDDYRDRGIWLILFDSFDEIPAVLHAPSGSDVILQHTNAIRQFLAGMSNCRGVIASREFKGPDALPWQKLRILPLCLRKQEELVNNTFLCESEKETVRQHIASSSSNLHQNPLFLALLCRYVKAEKHSPANDYALLERHIARLAARDVEHTKTRYGLSPDELIEGARQLAVLFAMEPTLSLAPTMNEILRAMPSRDMFGHDVENLLAALVDVKIGRSDVPEAHAGDRRFTFSHRRYQETLFVQHLARNPSVVPSRQLLTDLRWRDYAVTLLQTQPSGVLHPLLDEAMVLLDEFARQQVSVPVLESLRSPLRYFQWNNAPAVHLLSLLQEGLCDRLEDVPACLRQQVEAFLGPRWNDGDLYDRTRVIQLGGLLPEDILVERMAFAVTDGPSEMEDYGFRNVVFLKHPPSTLADWFRRRLSGKVLAARGKVELRRLEALAARLPDSLGAKLVLTRCRRLRVLTGSCWSPDLVSPVARLLGIAQLQVGKRMSEKWILANVAYALMTSLIVCISFMVRQITSSPPRLLSAAVALIVAGAIVCVSITFVFRSTPQHIGLAKVTRVLRPASWSRRFRRQMGVGGAIMLVCFVAALLLGGTAHFLAWVCGWDVPAQFWYVGAFIAPVFFWEVLVTVYLGPHMCYSLIAARMRLRHLLKRLPDKAVPALYATSMLELSIWLMLAPERVLPTTNAVRSVLRILPMSIARVEVGLLGFLWPFHRRSPVSLRRTEFGDCANDEVPLLRAVSAQGDGMNQTKWLLVGRLCTAESRQEAR
jgi:hypothetical protein